ncbi:LacI family DNA-binding transcriptional regulator [Saccharibacillus alkalitolerans]|uniref:LacI family transcriptional regulator n=1 Tax=Saccharibacillus alkalitolerans TaxID=2705290 RepID=A0ABX0FB76_9BACL|nr:LacI family DNA-binding transcriptional regulator [Saccharibacillus alkalitolerans]NGZ76724.1 LacI family transcriptional regulator [Saccharibacillus alkalitolerans]
MARPKKVSMQNIADRLGLSKNAVSLALSGKKGVSEEVRQTVLKTAKELDYRLSGSGLAGEEKGNARNVLVLVPERIVSYADNEHFRFFHDMLWILEESIRARGCNAVIARIDGEMERDRVLPGLFEDVEHAGVILFGIAAKPYAQMVWETGAPLVLLDSYYRDLPSAAAVSANTEGAESAVRWLIERGHREIGFIGPANLTTSHEERWFGYWRAMREAGLPIREAHTLLEADDFDEAKNEREIGEFLERIVAAKAGSPNVGQSAEDALPTAFFCGNDRIALLLIRRLRAIGVSVPQRVEVAGFDGLEQALKPDSGLSVTVKADKRRMCEAAVELLLGGYGGRREAVRWAAEGILVNM